MFERFGGIKKIMSPKIKVKIFWDRKKQISKKKKVWWKKYNSFFFNILGHEVSKKNKICSIE